MRTIRCLWPLLPLAAIVALLAAIHRPAPVRVLRPQGPWQDAHCKGAGIPHAMIFKQDYRWRDAWARLGPTRGAPPAPSLDEKSAIGIAIFLGGSGVLGPRIKLDSIIATEARLIIEASGIYPEGPAPTMPSNPCFFFQIERPNTPILVRARFRNTYVEVTD